MQNQRNLSSPYQSIAPNCSVPEGLSIRPPTVGDAEGLTNLQNLPNYRYGTLRLPFVRVQEIEKRITTAPSDFVGLVGVKDNIIVAFAVLNRASGRRSHTATIGMGVHDDFTGQGIGRAMLNELVELADNWLDLMRLELTVFTDNTAAITLYKSFGFQREGLLRSFAFRAGVYVDAFSMARLRSCDTE